MHQLHATGVGGEFAAFKENIFCERVSDGGALEVLQRDARRLDSREEPPFPFPRGPSYLHRNPLFFFSGSSINLFREPLNHFEIRPDARGRADDRHRGADEVVAVGAEEVVVLDERRGRKDDGRAARRVGQEGVHDDDELARFERPRDRRRVRQHRDGVAGRHPDGPDRRGLGREDPGAEERLGDRARRGLFQEGRVERPAPLEVERHAPARNPEVSADRSERVERADDGRAVHPAAHAPAHLDRAGPFAERGGDRVYVLEADVGRAGPVRGGVQRRERAELGEVVAEESRVRIRAARLEEPRGDAHRKVEVSARAHEDRAVGDPCGLVVDRVHEEHARTLLLRLLEHRHEVDVRDGGILTPEEDVLRVQEIEEIMRLLVAEIGRLCGVAGARADVAALHGDRP